MLIDGADPIWRQLLEETFASEDDEALKRGFDALRAESDFRRAQNEKIEGEQRRKAGAPVHARLVDRGVLDAAYDEWVEITGGGGSQADDGGAV